MILKAINFNPKTGMHIKKSFDGGWTNADRGGEASRGLEVSLVGWNFPYTSNCPRKPKTSHGIHIFFYIPNKNLYVFINSNLILYLSYFEGSPIINKRRLCS